MLDKKFLRSGKINFIFNFISVLVPYPQAVLAKSPNPSTDKYMLHRMAIHEMQMINEHNDAQYY